MNTGTGTDIATSPTNQSAAPPTGWTVYHRSDAGAPQLHTDGEWYFEPVGWDGDVYSEGYETRRAAVEACHEWTVQERLEIHCALEDGEEASAIAARYGLAYDLDEDAVVLPTWYADDGDASVETYATTAEEAAQEYVEGGDWGERSSSTTWVKVYTWQVGLAVDDGEVEEVQVNYGFQLVALDPDEPECRCRDDGHEWCSPHEVVGGCEDNPGVWGSGGGVVHTEVCRHCAAYRTTDTWAQCPETGEQGLRSVTYRPADDRSNGWLDGHRDLEGAILQGSRGGA